MDSLIYDIQVERGLHRPDVAMNTIQRAASLVKPLMRAHNFKVGLLAEFLPSDRGLLGKSIDLKTYPCSLTILRSQHRRREDYSCPPSPCHGSNSILHVSNDHGHSAS